MTVGHFHQQSHLFSNGIPVDFFGDVFPMALVRTLGNPSIETSTSHLPTSFSCHFSDTMKGGGGASIKKKTSSKSKQSKARQQLEVSVDKPKQKGQTAKVRTKNKIEKEAKAKGKKNKAPSFKTLSLQEGVRRSSPGTIAVPMSKQQPAVCQSDPALGVEDDSAEDEASVSRSLKKNKRVGKQPRQRKSTAWIHGGRFMKSNPEKNLVSELALTFS